MASALPDVTGGVSTIQLNDDSASENSEDHARRDGPSVTPQEITWQEEESLDSVSGEGCLPRICQFESTGTLGNGLKVYSKQPVMFHHREKKRQSRARTIYKDPSGAYFEIGETLIIPEKYSGWFELVPSDFSRASCFQSIDAVAKEMPPQFFTRSNLKAIRVEGEGEQQKYLERKIPSGSVLQTKEIFKAKWKTRASTGMLKKKTTEFEMEEVSYLRCVDTDGLEVLVPCSHRGKFNSIYERGKLTLNAVYSMQDILTDLSLPIKVRLLYGKAPVVPCIFTGMLILRDLTTDDVIIGSTILNKRNVLFELPINSPITVKSTPSDDPFAEKETYRDAQKLCRKYAHLFSSLVKLSPEQATGQKVLQHVPTDLGKSSQADESLRALDLITDISLGSEPRDQLMDGSESGSIGSRELDYRARESHTHV